MRMLLLPALAVLLLAADDQEKKTTPDKLPEGPGRATTQRLCGSCHGIGNFIRRRETRDGWNAVIEDMIRRGAQGQDEEWLEVSDYLYAQFPKQ